MIRSILKRTKQAFITATLCSLTIAHAQSFVVSDIRVNGLERLGSGVIFQNLNIQPGKSVNSDNFPEMIRKLYQLGFFEDVSLDRQGNVLVINVKERPAIDQITFSGNKDISTKRFNEILRDIGFYPGQVFDAARLNEIKKNIYQSYEGRGKYNVDIKTNITELPRNRVKVDFNISEGRTGLIKQLNITGNDAFSDGKLKKQFDTGTTGFFTFLSQRDRFSQEKLEQDLEKLKAFYQDRGYMKFEINSSNVALSENKREIYIDIDVNEGSQYTITGFDITGNTAAVPKEELMQLINIDTGSIYNRSKIQKSIKDIQDRIGDDGYAMARINAIPNIDEVNKTVAFTFAVDPGERTYVRRIVVAGNQRTQDEVFRREVRQIEGGWFVSRDVERSRLRIQRLPYVEQVTAEPIQVASDQIDIRYNVKERSAGSATLSLTYGQENKFGVSAGIQQPNFMGSGKDFGINIEADDTTRSGGINFTDPYFTDDGLSAGIYLNYTETNSESKVTGAYISDSYIVGLKFGYPISEYSNVYLDLGYEYLRLKSTIESPYEIVNLLGGNCMPSNNGFCDPAQIVKDKKNLFRSGLSWIRDTRDRSIFASQGNYTRASITGTIAGSDDTFYKLNLNHQFFYPLWEEDVVFTLRGDINYGDGYGSTEDLPFYEQFYSGGLRTVRGYRSSSLGPRYFNGQVAGGAFKTNLTAEVVMAVPGLTENRNIRWSAFTDAGQVFKNRSDFSTDELRYSAGVSFAWLSPMGPLVFAYAKPINEKTGDDKQSFQFSIGIPF